MENYYYYSEMGCIKIGNENFNSLLLNGKGEGSFWIHLYNRNEKPNKDGYEFVSQISGKDINIYDNDLGKTSIKKLDPGNYLIFINKGNILIEKKELKKV